MKNNEDTHSEDSLACMRNAAFCVSVQTGQEIPFVGSLLTDFWHEALWSWAAQADLC